MTAGGGQAEEERERLARELLLEALHQARALTGEPGPAPAESPSGSCSEVDEDLTARGRELFHTLWPHPMSPTRAGRMRDVVRRYVDRAEALARRRDRFVHDFRTQHGFDRASYTRDEAHALERGLEELETESRTGLAGAARELLEAEVADSPARGAPDAGAD